VTVTATCKPVPVPDRELVTATIASTMIFGSGAECPGEYYCLPGLREVYGLTFKEFRTVDPGGPLTVEALRAGQIDIGVLFTTCPQLEAGGGNLVLLDDDRRLQPPEQVVPVVGAGLRNLAAPIDRALVDVSRALTTESLARLNREIDLRDRPRPEAVADWLERAAPCRASGHPPGGVRTLRVASADFSESMTISEIYAQALTRQGFEVERVGAAGNRDAYFPQLVAGTFDLVPEYVGSLLAFLEAGEAQDAAGGALPRMGLASALGRLEGKLGRAGAALLTPATGQSQNGIAVTAGTASRYGLRRVSDLSRAVPGPGNPE
jgi:osmoprotectant transport system substrate-binding protein